MEVKDEALVGHKSALIRYRFAGVDTSVDVDRQVERVAVPQLIRVNRLVWRVRYELPTVEVLVERRLVLDEDADVDVAVFTGSLAEPGVDRPAAAEGPRRGERRHQLDDRRHRFGDVVRGVSRVRFGQDLLLVMARSDTRKEVTVGQERTRRRAAAGEFYEARTAGRIGVVIDI